MCCPRLLRAASRRAIAAAFASVHRTNAQSIVDHIAYVLGEQREKHKRTRPNRVANTHVQVSDYVARYTMTTSGFVLVTDATRCPASALAAAAAAGCCGCCFIEWALDCCVISHTSCCCS